MPIFPNPLAPNRKKPDDEAQLRAVASARLKAKATPPVPTVNPAATGALASLGGAGGGSRPPVSSPADVQNSATSAIRGIGGGSGRHVDPNASAADSQLTDLARLRQQQAKDKQAATDQLAADKAKSQQAIGARAGVGGFGMFGGTATALNDNARVQDRNSTLTLADLTTKQNDEQFKEIQRQQALNDLEASMDQDVDGDGRIGTDKIGGTVGDGDPENNPAKTKGEQHKKDDAAIADARTGMSGDGGDFSPYTGDVQDAQDLKDAGLGYKADDARLEGGNGDYFVVVRGSDGKLYKFAVSDEDATAAMPGTAYDIGRKILQSLGLA